MKKFVSWNVNGIRAALKKDFMESFLQLDADIFCLQETKVQAGQAELVLPGYTQYWNFAQRKGYSGTAVFTKEEPLRVAYGIGDPAHDTEGRVITLEFPSYYLLTLYTPNSRDGLTRLAYRMQWEDAFLGYVNTLALQKPVVFCGDLNVAHQEIDLKRPAANRRNPGFTDEERGKFTALLEAGFTDSFRYVYPQQRDAYSWWSYRANARQNNVGWRIDYFVVSDVLQEKVLDAKIHSGIFGSDHCPVEVDMDL